MVLSLSLSIIIIIVSLGFVLCMIGLWENKWNYNGISFWINLTVFYMRKMRALFDSSYLGDCVV